MNPAVAAAVFPVIFLGELPDKTMFASLVMATRGRPFAVWLGATAAFAVHVVIATTWASCSSTSFPTGPWKSPLPSHSSRGRFHAPRRAAWRG